MATEFTGQSSEVFKTSELLPPTNLKPTAPGDRRPHPRRSATPPLPIWERGSGGEGLNPTALGDLPAEWEVVRLGDFLDEGAIRIKNGFPFGGFNEEGNGIPHLRPFNINNQGQVDLSSIKSIETDRDLEAYFLQPGDIFFNNTNSEELVGKTAIWEKSGIFVYSNHMTSIRVLDRQKLDPFFLACYFHRRWQEGYFQTLCRRHVNQASISLARMRQIPIPLPPLDEQRRIAHVLNTVQQAMAAQDDLIAAAQEVKRSLMRRLFTYGPGSEPAPTKETEIGEVPEHWEVVQLGKIAKIERGKFANRPRNDPKFYGGKTPFIQTGDVAKASGRITTYSQTLNELGLSISRVFPKGTIVITIAANIGYTGILEFDSAFPDSLIGITPDESVDRFFLEYYLQTQQPKMDKMAPQGTQKNINIQFLKPWPILKPPINEQRQIAHILQTVDAKIAAEQDRRAALQALFNSLLQELMTGKLRV